MKNLKLMETIKNKIKLMEVIIDSDIFRNFIDDKVGIVGKSKTAGGGSFKIIWNKRK